MAKWVRRVLLGVLTVFLLGLTFVTVGFVRAWPVIGPDGWNPRAVFMSDEIAREISRFYELPDLAKDAARNGDFDEARELAEELLELAPRFPNNWNFGNAIHDAHAALGLVALSSGDMGAAKSHLLSAGQTRGSPQLDTFGPNMMLAEALLNEGEVRVVVEYFELCRSFWEMHDGRIDRWSTEASNGGVPCFGANLRY
jgi:hypothetical protein